MKKLIAKIELFFTQLFKGMRDVDTALTTNIKPLDSNICGIEENIKNEANSVYHQLLRGEVTEEVKELRYKTAVVSQKSTEYKYIGNSLAVLRKHKPILREENYLQTDGHSILMVSNKELQTIATHEVLEDVLGKEVLREEVYKFKVLYEVFPRIKYERYIEKIILKTNDTTNDIIVELYFSNIPKQFDTINKKLINDFKRLINDQTIDDDIKHMSSINFNEVIDETLGFKRHAVNAEHLEFINIEEFKMYYIVRFSCACEIKDIDFVEDIVHEATNIKYENKEEKPKPNPKTIDLATAIRITEEKVDTEKQQEIINKLKKK